MAVDIAAALLDYANHHCNQEWTVSDMPARVALFIEKATLFLANAQGIESKRLGDISVSYSTEFPRSLMNLLGRPKANFV